MICAHRASLFKGSKVGHFVCAVFKCNYFLIVPSMHEKLKPKIALSVHNTCLIKTLGEGVNRVGSRACQLVEVRHFACATGIYDHTRMHRPYSYVAQTILLCIKHRPYSYVHRPYSYVHRPYSYVLSTDHLSTDHTPMY